MKYRSVTNILPLDDILTHMHKSSMISYMNEKLSHKHQLDNKENLHSNKPQLIPTSNSTDLHRLNQELKKTKDLLLEKEKTLQHLSERLQ